MQRDPDRLGGDQTNRGEVGAFTNRPAVKFCIPFMAGILIGWYLPTEVGSKISTPAGGNSQFHIAANWHSFDSFLCIVITVIAAAILTGIFLRRFPAGRAILLFLLIVLFGFVKITFDAWRLPADAVSNLVARGKIVLLRGRISEEPSAGRRSLRFVIEAESIRAGARYRELSGGVLVTARKKDIDTSAIGLLTYGRTVILSGELRAPAAPRNPGEFDMGEYLRLNDIQATLSIRPSDTIRPGDGPNGDLLASLVYPVRRSAGRRIDRLIGGDEGKFLKGLLIGDRVEITPEVKTAFINSGVMHIIAVSGLHVAIVALILFGVMQAVRVPENVRIASTCFLLIYYIFLTGAAASVTRSAIMAIVFLTGKLGQRKPDFYNTLALSAIIILLIDSKQLLQPGFQLSYAAVFSLVYLYPKLYAAKRFLPRRLGRRSWISPCAAVISVSLAAGIGTLPFTSVYFGKVSLVSFAANIIVVPLSNVILAAGMVTIGVSYFSTWLASVFAGTTGLLTSCLLRIVTFFGSLPFAYLNSHFTLWSSLAFYGAVGFVIGVSRRETRRNSIIALLFAADTLLYLHLLFADSRKLLRVTFLDVGQGDAALLELPDGKTLLLDAGPAGGSVDAGARFVAPLLRWKGIGKINGIVLSHPHSDHLGGIPYLFRNLTVDEVVDAGSWAHSSLFRDYRRCIDSLGIPRRITGAGGLLGGFDGVRIYILHPSRGFVPHDTAGHGNLNNQSLVLKLVYGKSSLLLAGDAEREAEDRMIAVYGPFLKSDVLKTGHHGSITSSSDQFLKLVRPSMAVVSVGERNKFHLPSAIVLRRLSDRGARYFRTDEKGAVVIESDGEGWTLINWRQYGR